MKLNLTIAAAIFAAVFTGNGAHADPRVTDASYDLILNFEAVRNEADDKLRASNNELKQEIIKKEAEKKLCSLETELAKMTVWGGIIYTIEKDGPNLEIKVQLGTKFYATIRVQNTQENVDYLTNRDTGDRIIFSAKLSTGEPYTKWTSEGDRFCSYDSYWMKKGRLFFENIGTGSANTFNKDYYTARLVGAEAAR